MPRLLSIQFVRYLVVGAFNTVFAYGVYAAGLFLGLPFQLANFIALVVGIAFSFTTQGALVFKNATRVTLVKFILAWLAIYLFNIALIALLMRVSFSTYLAGALATVPVTLVSYFVLKHIVFVRRPSFDSIT